MIGFALSGRVQMNDIAVSIGWIICTLKKMGNAHKHGILNAQRKAYKLEDTGTGFAKCHITNWSRDPSCPDCNLS